MPRTISQAFDLFHSNITPSGGIVDAAKAHRASLKACLERSFTLDYFFQSGSSGNGTNVYGLSDVDFMAVVPRSQLKQNSDRTLIQFRDVLKASFSSTNIHISKPAIVVPFGLNGRETTEIVPAELTGHNSKGDALFEIADGSGGWLKTSPRAHNTYVTDTNISNNYMVKPLIRFVKAWKYYNDVPISSFYLEMRVAKYVNTYCTTRGLSYLVDLHYFFNYLSMNGLASLQDPVGNTGYIQPCSTDAKRVEAIRKINTAVTRSRYAMDYELAGNTITAFTWFNKLFNGRFPSYYF